MKIEKIIQKKIASNTAKKVANKITIKNILKTKKTVNVKLGPNLLHGVLDVLQIKH